MKGQTLGGYEAITACYMTNMSGSTTFSFLLYIPLHRINHFNFPGIIIEEGSSFRTLHSPSLLVDIFTNTQTITVLMPALYSHSFADSFIIWMLGR